MSHPKMPADSKVSALGWFVLHATTAEDGERFAVLACPRCGAAVATHPVIDTTAIHNRWHREEGL